MNALAKPPPLPNTQERGRELLRSLRKNITILIGFRIVLLCTTLLSATFVTFRAQTSEQKLLFVYLPIAALLLFSVLSIWWARTRETKSSFVYLQLISDIFIATGIIYLSGGPTSPFLFLYIPLAMACALFTSRTESLGLSTVATAAYALISTCMAQGIILPANGSTPPEMSDLELFLQLVQLFSSMILTSVATSYLTERLNVSHQLVEQGQRALSALNERQQLLVNGLPEGVLVVNTEGKVLSANQIFCGLLQCNPDEIIQRDFCDVLHGFDPDAEVPNLEDLDFTEAKEIDVHLSTGGVKHIVYQGRPLTDENGAATAILYVFEDVTRLRSVEEQLAVQERMARLLSEQQEPVAEYTRMTDFVGETPAMHKIYNLIDKVSKSDATALINGESGTGKELVARAIHSGSVRNAGPFIAVNCGAIPENLIESQLFGHKKGSFTGAESDAVGLFQQSEGGTILLDEIGELPIQMQSKLLRVIQERVVRPIGGEHDLPIDVRIVAATNRNLKQEVAEQKFREDLYYRLNVISIKLPPLRQRKDDIPLLIHALLHKLEVESQQSMVSPEAMRLLTSYDYPGNVRELENILERALVLGGDVILPEHLPEAVRQGPQAKASGSASTQIIIDENIEFPVDLDDLLQTVERSYLEAALKQASGVKKRAAGMLGINFRSFRYRLQKFGID